MRFPQRAWIGLGVLAALGLAACRPMDLPATPTAAPTAGAAPAVMCTPPPCQTGEAFFCPSGDCPGGCGTTCATHTPGAPAADSGIQGLVLIGPACPVVRVDAPCPDKPFQAALTVLDPAGRPAAQLQSDENGFFQVALPPGTYRLHPERSLRAGAPDQDVVVSAGQWVSVTVTYDSGLR